MNGVEVEDVICRREKQPRPACEDQRLQHVDHLRDVCTAHAIGVVAENVERDRSDERVTQRVLLVQEAGVGSGLDVVPHPPFADDERDALARIVLVHDRRVTRDQLLHSEGSFHGEEPLLLAELGRGALVRPGADDGVVMQIETVDHPAGLTHHHLGPVVIVGVGPGRDAERTRRVVERTQELRESAILIGVELRAHRATASPALVADAEAAHVVRRSVTVHLPLVRDRAAAGVIHVLPPLGHLARRPSPHVANDERFGADAPNELEVLLGPETVVFDDIAPDGVDHVWPPTGGANAVAPVVVVSKAAAGPPHVRHLDSSERFDDVVAQVPLAGPFFRPNALVDAVSEMFGELTVDVTTDRVVAQARIDDETRNRSGSTGRLGALCLCPREGGESRAECSDNGDACHGSGERSEDDVYDSLFAGAFYDAARAFARCPCHSRYADGIPRVSQ